MKFVSQSSFSTPQHLESVSQEPEAAHLGPDAVDRKKMLHLARQLDASQRRVNQLEQQLTDLQKKARSSHWIFKEAAKKIIHAPRDVSRRIRRSKHDGKKEKWSTRREKPVSVFRPKAPNWSEFHEIASRRKLLSETPKVGVIVSVYRGYDDTLACLASVLRSNNRTSFELIVIDDCSPEPGISDALVRLAELGLLTLLQNESNLGFVGTVNRGMALHPDRDVVLLNSDTLVFNDWLDRLKAHASSTVATVTPFTNNGTICSYPEFGCDNAAILDIPYEELDQLAAHVNRGQSVDLPTGVGFCMYVTRTALKAVGYFDQNLFGKGYGEENDFCMRAQKCSLRNVHALDAFVFHSGETSFGENASGGKKRALKTLEKLHPDYLGGVRKHVALDPARPARASLDLARLIGASPSDAILCFAHTWGGGIERHLRDRTDRLRKEGRDIILAVPCKRGSNHVNLSHINAKSEYENLSGFDLEKDLVALKEVILKLNIRSIEVHSTAGWSINALESIPKLSEICALRYSFYLHDYIPICPQINLIDDSGIYCGEKGEENCRKCLIKNRKAPKQVHPDAGKILKNITAWRKSYHYILESASDIIAPSEDTARRYAAYFSGLSIQVRPHKEDLSEIQPVAQVRKERDTLKVITIGAIGPHKGSKILQLCAEDAIRRELPIEFCVIGHSDRH